MNLLIIAPSSAGLYQDLKKNFSAIETNLNIIRNCVTHHVKKLFAFSSVCVFPDSLEILEEDKMHTGPVFESNFAYGYAKRMVDVHIRAAEKQYKVKNWVSFIPGNIMVYR